MLEYATPNGACSAAQPLPWRRVDSADLEPLKRANSSAAEGKPPVPWASQIPVQRSNNASGIRARDTVALRSSGRLAGWRPLTP